MSRRARVLFLAVVAGTVSGRCHAASVLCAGIGMPPGAIYLYTDGATSTVFNGNAFAIDGHDWTLAGTPGPQSPIVGLATRTETNAQEARDSLSSNQKDNVQGAGYEAGPPIQSSIAAVPGPAAGAIDRFVDDLLALPGVVTIAGDAIHGALPLGSAANPGVSHLTGTGSGVTVAANGNVTGAGILVVEDGLTVLGALGFEGLVIVRGALVAPGLLQVLGSTWTTNLTAAVGGSMIAYYSSEALALATGAGGGLVCETAVCGDGIRTYDEGCDDGNSADGDCCSPSCTWIGNDASCDDGNACTTDGCVAGGACRHDAVVGACDDADACTAGDACVDGVCAGMPVTCEACFGCDPDVGCRPAPKSGCRMPFDERSARLTAKDSSSDDRDRLSWSWKRGEATSLADFGDPLGTDGYTLCVFGPPATSTLFVRASAAPGGSCGARSCWRARPTGRGFVYYDRTARGGLRKIRLTVGDDGKADVRVAGAGAHLGPLGGLWVRPITVQLQSNGGACWEAVHRW